MAKITYNKGSIELDPEMVQLLTNEKTSKVIIESIDRLVKLEEIKAESKREAFRNGTKSLSKIADTISKGMDMFFDGGVNVSTTIEDNRTPEEVEKDINDKYNWAEEE